MSFYRPFSAKLEGQQKKNDSLLTVGLDSDLARIPDIFLGEEHPQFAFNRMVIDATKDVVSSYKIQMAFYEEQGLRGYESLVKTLSYIPPDIPVVADAKRNDIGNTCRAYARAFFSKLGFDALTVNPYLGFESIVPFLHEAVGADRKEDMYDGKAVFVLAKTSNPGSGDLQDLRAGGDRRIYQLLVRNFSAKYHELRESEGKEQGSAPAEMGFVVGATYPEELKDVRKVVGEDCLLLIPGIGAQGGDIEKTIRYGTNSRGRGVLINSSRGIIFPDPRNEKEKDVDLIGERVREAAVSLRDELNRWR